VHKKSTEENNFNFPAWLTAFVFATVENIFRDFHQ